MGGDAGLDASGGRRSECFAPSGMGGGDECIHIIGGSRRIPTDARSIEISENIHLGYEKYAIAHKQTPNSRNGHSKKTMST